jgi:hypothetical protein
VQCPSRRRSAAAISAGLAILLVLVAASAARADEIAYSCGGDICTIDPDHTETHADLTKTESDTEFEPDLVPGPNPDRVQGERQPGQSRPH